MELFLVIALLVSWVLVGIAWWDRARVKDWARLALDYSQRCDRYPIDDESFLSVEYLVSVFIVICIELSVSPLGVSRRNEMLCRRLGDIAEQLEKQDFFEKTDVS